MQKWVEINFYKCDPKKCDPKNGVCKATKVCKHEILEQDEPFETPMHAARDLCIGCLDCVNACPLKALEAKK